MTNKEKLEALFDAIQLLRSFNVGCAPEYECSMDYDSPCEIRARAVHTLSDKMFSEGLIFER